MRTHGAVVGRRFRSVTKLTTKVRVDRGYLCGSFLIAAAALKTPTRNGYNAQGVNLNVHVYICRISMALLITDPSTNAVFGGIPCGGKHIIIINICVARAVLNRRDTTRSSQLQQRCMFNAFLVDVSACVLIRVRI